MYVSYTWLTNVCYESSWHMLMQFYVLIPHKSHPLQPQRRRHRRRHFHFLMFGFHDHMCLLHPYCTLKYKIQL